MTSQASVGAGGSPLARIPVFVHAQAECVTCGREIRDALQIETWGRYCSPRCYYARDLPRLIRQGA